MNNSYAKFRNPLVLNGVLIVVAVINDKQNNHYKFSIYIKVYLRPYAGNLSICPVKGRREPLFRVI